MHIRRPIQKESLNILLKSVDYYFTAIEQEYLRKMYMALFSMAYYGLFRIGELAEGTHTVKAIDVHIAINKRKLLFILRSSKTHGLDVHPQMIKISSTRIIQHRNPESKQFCPYQLLRTYLEARGKYISPHENFFIFLDHSPV